MNLLHRLSVIAIIILLTASSMISLTSAQSEAYIARATRTIVVNDFGVTTVTDAMMVTNGGTRPLEALDIGFPKAYSKGLELVEARGGTGELVRVERVINESSPTQWMRCRLGQPVSAGGTYELKLSLIFSNLITFDGKEYTLSFAAYPTLQLRADSYNSTVILPKAASPLVWPNQTYAKGQVEGNPALRGLKKPLQPFSSTEFSLKYTNTGQTLISFKSIQREIDIAPEGNIHSIDTYRITNLGADMNTITLPRPKNMSPIMLYDTAGPIQEKLQAQKDIITVAPRFGKLTKGSSFTFRLEYDLPVQDSLRRLELLGRYRFTAELARANEYVVEKYLVNISLPRGTKIETLSSQPNSTSTLPDGGLMLTYDLGRLPPNQAKAATVEYRFQILSSSLHPLQWVFFFEIVVGACMAAIFLKRTPKAAVPVSIERIRRFTDLHDEKRSLRLELEKREEAITRGSITKHEYRRRRRLIETRISELNRSLTTLKNELKAVDPKYDQMARRLEKAEGELEALGVSESQIMAQYRAGRIGREVCESLLRDLRKRTERAKATVDSIIVTLREEAR